MEKNKNAIPFLNIYLKCVEKINGDITKDEFEEFLNEEIEVKNYISIQIKKSLIDIFFLVNNDSNNDFIDISFAYEVYSILGFLIMYTNIDVSPDEMIEDNYDIVIQSGLAEYIQSKCNNDYQRLYKMGLNAVLFKNSFIIDSLSDLTPDNLIGATNNAKDFVGNMSENKLSLIKDILELNDPNMIKTKESIYSGIDLFMKDKKLQDLKER